MKQLDILPQRLGNAAENMVADFMLLQHYATESIRFRHYGWRHPAFTFGYGQKIDFVRAQLPADVAVELCRRPTGGGVVDHRNDWTYALVVPRGHPVEKMQARDSYRLVHQCVANSFNNLDQPAVLNGQSHPGEIREPTVCFSRAEVFDVIDPASRNKIAGAAQKRNQRGMLFQGSIARSTVDAKLDWNVFEQKFLVSLANMLDTDATAVAWPSWTEQEVGELVAQYSSSAWLELR